MARQALIKLRRGTGLPANNVLDEGELAIDIAAKKLYSANSSGIAFTLSGDQYDLTQSGNASHGVITLTVDNDTLSNDSIFITGGTDVTVAGNSTLINVNVTSTLSSVTGRGATTTEAVGLGNTTITGFANVTTDLHVGTTSQFDGTITVGNSTVNAVIASTGNIDTDGTLTVAGATQINNTLAVGNTTVTGFANVTETVQVGSNVIINTSALFIGNSTVNTVITSASIDVDGTLAAGNTTLVGFLNVSSTGAFAGDVTVTSNTGSTSVGSGALVVTGGVGISENLYVGGNLYVEGTTTQVSSTTVTINDNLIKLAANQTGTDEDLVDTGWYMTYDVSDTQNYAGVIRDTSNANKAFVFFKDVTTEPTGTVTYTSSDLAYIEAIIDGGTY